VLTVSTVQLEPTLRPQFPCMGDLVVSRLANPMSHTHFAEIFRYMLDGVRNSAEMAWKIGTRLGGLGDWAAVANTSRIVSSDGSMPSCCGHTVSPVLADWCGCIHTGGALIGLSEFMSMLCKATTRVRGVKVYTNNLYSNPSSNTNRKGQRSDRKSYRYALDPTWRPTQLSFYKV